MSSNPIPMRFEQKANSSTNNILINANSPSSSNNNNRSTSDFFSLRKRSDPNYSSTANVLDSTISLTGNLTSTSPPTIVTTPSISSSSSSSHTTSSSFLKSRRSSSVFEQVGGILDRFGRRLHSRSEIRDSTSSSRRPSSSFFNSTTNNGGSGSGGGSGSSVGIGSGGDLSIIPSIKSTDLGEAVSLEEYSPSENPTLNNIASQSSSSLVGSQSGASGDRTASGVSITLPYTASPTLTGLERVRSPSIRETEEGPSSYVGRNSIYSPPLMQRNYSAGSSSFHFENNTATTIGPIASPPLSTTSSNRHQNLVSRDSRRLSVMERTLIQVTEDNERFSVVDVSGLNSAAAIKERMLSKLHLFDEDPSCFALSQTEIGAVGSTGPRLDDDELLAMCWQMGDEKGTLKFLLHQIAPPAAANRAMVPPPQNLSPHIVTRDLGGGGEFATSATTNTATTTTTTPTTASRQQNSKTGSISSSRSSVNENGEGQAQQQQQQANNQSISHDSSSETSSSRPHSALIRSKATNRRSLATSSSSHTDDAGRPLSLAASADEAYDHSRSTPSTLHQLPNLNTSLQADSMYEQCSPIEEVSDALNVDDGRFGSQRRAVRPSTTQSRHTIHGQWESEMGGSASGGGPSNRSTGSTPSALERARPNNQRTSSHPSSIIDSNASLSSPSNASQNLPRSLLPGGGGREARAVDKTDASRMYISSHDQEYSDSNNANGSTLRPYASHSALNATTEDGRRRSKPSIHESSSGSQHRQQNDPTLRSQSVAPHSQRPSTGDATHGNNLPSFGPAHHQHTSPTPSHNYIMSPISPLTRPFDRERSSSFGAAPLPQSYRNMGPGTIHDQRAISIPRQGQAPIISMPRAPGQQQQHSGGHHPQGHTMHGQSPGHGYISSPPMRPMQPLGQFPPQGDRRFIGPSQTQGNIRPAQMYLPHEFGGRIQSLYDPRVGPYSTAPRPHSMQDWGNRYYQQQPPPQQQQQQSFRPPREDPYTSAHFPASSPRMVSEFQRSASTRVALQPGMTVQESLASAAAQHRNQQQQQQFRPQSPYMTHSPRPAASSVSMTQAASLPPSYAYDNRQSQHHHSQHSQQNPAMRTTGYDKRTEGSIISQSSNNSNNNSSSRIPASMQYYYNPATPTSTPRPLIAPAASTSAPPPTQTSASSNDRSSGSSFVTNQSSSSHTRVTSSSEDRRQEGEHSAPTSARSSRSMGSKNEERKENVTSDSELPYAHDSVDSIKQLSNLTRQDSLNDEDLLKIRPLPTLPMIGKIVSADSKDEGTFKAGQWKEMMLKSLEDEDEGTARATNTKAEKEFANVTNVSSTNHLQDTETSPKGSSTTSLGTAIPDPDMIRDGEGTFKTFDDDDDDDDIEGGTWAQPLDSAVQQTVKDSVISNVMNRVKSPRPEDGTLMPNAANADTLSGSNSPRKPILTLNIESPPSLTIKDINAISSSPDSSTIPGLQQPTPSPGSSNLGRQPSFARRERGDWAFRPPPEQLYENLDDFFPKADLDKPVIDPNAGLAGSNVANQGINPSSPQANSPRVESISSASNMPIAASFAMTPATNTVTQSEKQTTESDSPHEPATSSAISPISRSRMQHKKSIRIVAQDRKKLLDRVEAAEQRKSGATDLNRRRSTKLWGGKVIEVTPGTENSSISSQLESPTSASSTTSDQQKPVFKWVKGDLIGKGTYGRVYLALNATTGEMIAVKQVELPRTASDREDARQKGVVAALKSEIETLKDLDHPNIVSYLGFEETKCNLSIFLEYVPGGSVGSCLRKHGKLDEATIKSFLQQILNGLNYLHGRGILHRDLKADNLLVDFNGIVKISDFGTVRKSEDIYGNVASMSMQGSIFWMAPEVLSRAGYSAKVDIWSLGCVVLEMFAGRRPWSDEEAVQAMFKIGAERRAPPIPPDVRLSKAAAHFLKICFAVDPNERPTANKLLIHVFPHAEPGWQFSMSSLYQQLHR